MKELISFLPINTPAARSFRDDKRFLPAIRAGGHASRLARPCGPTEAPERAAAGRHSCIRIPRSSACLQVRASVAFAGTCMGTLSLLASDREPHVQPWSRGHRDTTSPGSPSLVGRSEFLARETVALLYSKPAPLLLGNRAR